MGNPEPVVEDKNVVEYSKYVGVKEMLGKREEELASAKKELDTLKATDNEKGANVLKLETEVQELNDQLKTAKDSGVDQAKVEGLQKQADKLQEDMLQAKRLKVVVDHEGIEAEDVKEMSAMELGMFVKGLEKAKGQVKPPEGDKIVPKPDLGGGEGVKEQVVKARDRMKAGFEQLHPQKE